MIVPYRCKNPAEQVPYVTVTLIGINVLFYLFTARYLTEIRPGIVADYAVWPGHCNPLRLLISMFLHEQPLHLVVNMWFLWLFGTAVEGRLGIPKYLLAYFTCGVGANLIQCFFESLGHSHTPEFGADGAVMGMAGAYMYIFPFARIMVFRFIIITLGQMYIGPAEWMAWWVVAFYVAVDVFNGLVASAIGMGDVTSYFTHLIGMIIGVLVVMVLRTRRDSEIVSQAQAVRADLGSDIQFLTVGELESIVDASTEDMDLVIAYCNKAMLEQGERGDRNALKAIERYKPLLLVRTESKTLADVVLRIPKEIGGVSGPFYLRLGSKLEKEQRFETAAYIYRRVYDIYQSTPDAGAALMRLSRIWEQVFFNPELSQEAYTVYLEHFSPGPLTEEARKGLERVNKALAGDKSGRLPSLESSFDKEYSFTLQSEPEEGVASNRPVPMPDLIDSPRRSDESDSKGPDR